MYGYTLFLHTNRSDVGDNLWGWVSSQSESWEPNLVLIRLNKSGKSILVSVLIVLLPLLMVVEGLRYHSYLSSVSKGAVNVFDLKQTDKVFQSNISAIDKNEYQAIIMLPYFYVGSDNYGKQSNDGLSRLGFMFSYHLNLPMFNSYLTRVS